MVDVVLLVTMFGICSGIGLPISTLLPASVFAWRVLLAPVFGFAAIAVCAPVAYYWGATVPAIFAGSIFVAAVLSAWSVWQTWRKPVVLSGPERHLTRIATAVTAAAVLVMIAPRWVGGDQFAVFQGNHWDTYGYLESAVIYAYEPYSVVSTASDEQIIRNPLYDLAKQSLMNRPSAHLLYGVFSRVLPGEAYRLYYAYLVGCLGQVVLVGLFTVRNLLPNASPLVWSGAALVFPLGFWGQYAFDINAWSQVASAPALLLMAGLVIHTAVATDLVKLSLMASIRLSGAIATVTAGAVYLYPEGVAFYIAALGAVVTVLFLVRLIRRRHLPMQRLIPIAGVGLGLATATLYVPLYEHLVRQLTGFSSVRVDWWKFFQVFLRGRDGESLEPWAAAVDFIGGLFGLYFATPAPRASALAAVSGRVIIAGTIIALLAALTLIVAGRARYTADDEATSEGRRLMGTWMAFWAMIWLPAAYLAWDGNYWPAGKVVSYAAPVFMMLLACPIAYRFSPRLRPLRWLAVAFVVFQIGNGFTRIQAAADTYGIHYAPPYPALQDRSLKVTMGWDLTSLERHVTPEMRVLITPMDLWQEHHLMVFLWSRRIPFATVSEVTTGFGSSRKLGALPAPWTPDVEVSARTLALVLKFRDGKPDLVIGTRKEAR